MSSEPSKQQTRHKSNKPRSIPPSNSKNHNNQSQPNAPHDNENDIEFKYDQKTSFIDSDSEEFEQEILVHNSDLRQPIYEFPKKIKDCNIIKCIGEIESIFSYQNHNYRTKTVGTGTVIYVQ
eukprot:12702_1